MESFIDPQLLFLVSHPTSIKTRRVEEFGPYDRAADEGNLLSDGLLSGVQDAEMTGKYGSSG